MRSPVLLDRARGIVVALIEGEGSPSDGEASLRGMEKGVSKKAHDLTTTPVKRADGEGFVASGTTDNGGRRMLVALRHGGAFGGVAIDCPAGMETVATAIADSVWLDASATLDPAALHGIALGKSDGLVVVTGLTPPLMIKEANVEPPIPPTSAGMYLMVLPATTEEGVRALLMSILDDRKVERKTLTSNDVTIDGTPAVELLGDAYDKPMPLKFFAVVLDDPGSMILAIGSYSPDRPQDLERLRAMMFGMHRVEGTLGPVKLP